MTVTGFNNFPPRVQRAIRHTVLNWLDWCVVKRVPADSLAAVLQEGLTVLAPRNRVTVEELQPVLFGVMLDIDAEAKRLGVDPPVLLCRLALARRMSRWPLERSRSDWDHTEWIDGLRRLAPRGGGFIPRTNNNQAGWP